MELSNYCSSYRKFLLFIISAREADLSVMLSSGTALDKRKLHQLKLSLLSDYGAA